MGMDRKVVFAADCARSWPQLRDWLNGRGVPVQLRMIDGQLAFPDEDAPDDWRELRVGTAEGMVTLRREVDGIRLVIWGNADAKTQRLWNAMTWAIAALTEGMVETSSEPQSSEEFARSYDLPEGMVGGDK
jgi:hypothetical protein